MENSSKNNNFEQSRTLQDRVVFFLVAMGAITVTLGFLALIDFLPEKPVTDEAKLSEENSTIVESARVEVEREPEPVHTSNERLPVSIVFDSLRREIPILNPVEKDIEALDNALLSGAVRHPDSADLLETGTMFILGHSSHLPTIRNRNFQAFNDIEKLKWGDIIRVKSGDTEYVYSVDRVYEVKASDAEVPLQYDVAKLVLATCNSFGTKDDRFIVEASLILSRPLAS